MAELTAFMLIKLKDGTLDRAIQELHKLSEVKEIYRIVGKYDLMAIIKGDTITETTNCMGKIEEEKSYFENGNSLFGNEV